jgi:hypothetical protein
MQESCGIVDVRKGNDYKRLGFKAETDECKMGNQCHNFWVRKGRKLVPYGRNL